MCSFLSIESILFSLTSSSMSSGTDSSVTSPMFSSAGIGLRGAVGVEGDIRSVESGTLTKFEEVFFLGRQPGIDMGDEVMAGGRIGRLLMSKAPFFPFRGFWGE